MVQPGRSPRHCDPFLSRPSPPDAARAQKDDRCRRGDGGGVYEHSPPRSRPCSAGGLSVAPPAPLAGGCPPHRQEPPTIVSAQSAQSPLRLSTSPRVPT